MVIQEFGDTADAVSAHLGLAAVGVEHAHTGIRLVRRADQDQAVRADAEMAIADGTAKSCRIMRNRVAKAIDIDIVVARPMHLGETHAFATSQTAIASAGL